MMAYSLKVSFFNISSIIETYYNLVLVDYEQFLFAIIFNQMD